MVDEAIPAATLIVVRDLAQGAPELLMVERAEAMAFAGGALVFPGGRIDDGDRALGEMLDIDPGIVAAIRETLEESAIPVGLDPVPTAPQARLLQEALLADRPLATLLDEHGLRLDHTACVPFARWVPKFHAVRRFDTRIYLAAAPAGAWQPVVVEGECAGAEWVTAAEVLDRTSKDEARLIFPTRRNLERLAQHESFAALVEDARAHPIEPVTPWVEECDGERFVTIPAHLGYPVTQERLDGLWRG